MLPLARPSSVWIIHEDHAVELTASLRTAIQLERLCDGWANLLVKLAQLDTNTIRQIIRIAASDRNAAETLIRSFSTTPLRNVVQTVSESLSALIELLLAPVSTDDSKPSTESAQPFSFAEGYSNLFGIGTAILGWSPDQTWNATQAEIIAAIEAKAKFMDMSSDQGTSRKASKPDTAYTSEKLKEIEALGHDPAFDREALRRLKDMS